ncbi:YcxB family protein [Stutzerimonas zhaodongensis]
MKVTTDIRKGDLIRLNVSALPRMRSTYITFIILACLTFGVLAWTKGLPEDSHELWIHLASSFIGGLTGLLFGFVFNVIAVLFLSSAKNGVLGEHTYTLTPEGIHESTTNNEGLTRWGGVISVRSMGSCLLVQIGACLYHIMPRRSFESSQAFDKFAAQAKAYWQQSQPE